MNPAEAAENASKIREKAPQRTSLAGTLKKNQLLMLICAASFCAGIVLGYFLYEESSEVLSPVMEEVGSQFSSAQSQPELAAWIFANNLRASLLMLVFGLLLPVPLLLLAANGFFFGFVFRAFLDKGYGVLDFAAATLPHGVLELPAVFLSAALGMRVCVSLIFPHGSRINAAAYSIREASAAYIAVVLPMLAAAALVEVYVSAALLPH